MKSLKQPRRLKLQRKAEAGARAAVSSLMPSKLFGNKGLDEDSSANTQIAEATPETREVQAGKEEDGRDQVGDFSSRLLEC